jgi:hypothetical protein
MCDEQFLDFKRAALASLGYQPPDDFEDLLHRLATSFGYQAMYGMETPWVLSTSIQLRSSSGIVMTEGGLTEVLGWIRERAPSPQMLKLAAIEARQLEAVASQSPSGGSVARL